MAHAATHPTANRPHRPARRGGGGAMFAGLLTGLVLAAALLIGWAVWSGITPVLHDAADDVVIALPRAPVVPVVPEPQPLPAPVPTPPR